MTPPSVGLSGDSAEFAEQAAERPSGPSLAVAVGRGFSWLTLSIIAGKVLGAVAQLLLGRWISDEQFGDLSIVASVAAMVKVLQDGGVPQVLIQRGDAEFGRLMGPAFWLSVAFGLASGGLLALAAPVVAHVYGTPSLTSLLLVVAISLPLGAASTILRAKLRVELRFRTIAHIAVFWFAIRHLSTIGLAASGFGAMSVAAPLVIVALYEWLADYYATRISPWRLPFGMSEWPGLIGSSFWVVSAAVSRGLARTGDYLVLGLFLPRGVVGQYFFGYQFTVQFIELLATNLQHVLFPALSRVADQPERQSRAILRSIRLLIFVASCASVGLAVIVRPLVTILDDLVWNDKWGATIPLMQVFAATAPVRMFTDVLTASMSSRGQFRRSAGLFLAEGVWLMGAAALAVAAVGDDLLGLSIVLACAQSIFSVVSSCYLLRSFDIPCRSFLAAFAPSWLAALAAGAGAAAIGIFLPADASEYWRLAAGGAAFATLFVVIARLVLASDLIELANLAPASVGRAMRAVLLLPDRRPTYDGTSK